MKKNKKTLEINLCLVEFCKHVLYDSDRVESQLYSDSKIIKLPQKLTELRHFQTLRGKE